MIEADRVELVAGVPQPVEVPRDDGSRQRIFRCPSCQVAVFSEYGRPEVRYVRAGTLDRPSEVTPDVHIFTRSKVSWITIPESAPAFEIYYDMKELWPAASLERLDAILAAARFRDLVPIMRTTPMGHGWDLPTIELGPADLYSPIG